MGHATESLLNHDIEGKQGHHHMSMIANTNINEDH
jgi:hypothetical protein